MQMPFIGRKGDFPLIQREANNRNVSITGIANTLNTTPGAASTAQIPFRLISVSQKI